MILPLMCIIAREIQQKFLFFFYFYINVKYVKFNIKLFLFHSFKMLNDNVATRDCGIL